MHVSYIAEELDVLNVIADRTYRYLLSVTCSRLLWKNFRTELKA
jgi:hypothetical protein